MFKQNLTRAFELLTKLPEDFFSERREDSQPQERSDSLVIDKKLLLKFKV